MSTLAPPTPVRFFVTVLAGEKASWESIQRRLESELGALCAGTADLPAFDTDYYEREMGAGLRQRIAALGGDRSPGDLPAIKVFTDAVERETAEGGRRTVNLDPGYVSADHVVVATGKPRAGRPYLDRGVYAYVALVFRHGAFVPLERTYPSYRSDETIAFFHGIRDALTSRGTTPPVKE